MITAIKRLVLVLLVVALPTQAVAAIVMPMCQHDASAAALSQHHVHDGAHDHDGHDGGQPLTAADLGLDHCSMGASLAMPAMSLGLALETTTTHIIFTVISPSGFIPDKLQRPPLIPLV